MGPAEVISADTERVVWQGLTSQVPVGWALAWLTSKVVWPWAGTDTWTAWVCPLVYSSLIVAVVGVVPKLARIKYSWKPVAATTLAAPVVTPPAVAMLSLKYIGRSTTIGKLELTDAAIWRPTGGVMVPRCRGKTVTVWVEQAGWPFCPQAPV